MGARHIVREHATSQTVLNKDIKRAARLLPARLLNMRECTAAFLSFLYRHSILAWCQEILVPRPYQPPPPPPSLRFLGSIRVWMRGRWKGLPLAEAAVGRFLFILSFPSLCLTKRRPRCRPERERKRETRRQRERVRESEREGERERGRESSRTNLFYRICYWMKLCQVCFHSSSHSPRFPASPPWPPVTRRRPGHPS